MANKIISNKSVTKKATKKGKRHLKQRVVIARLFCF